MSWPSRMCFEGNEAEGVIYQALQSVTNVLTPSFGTSNVGLCSLAIEGVAAIVANLRGFAERRQYYEIPTWVSFRPHKRDALSEILIG